MFFEFWIFGFFEVIEVVEVLVFEFFLKGVIQLFGEGGSLNKEEGREKWVE